MGQPWCEPGNWASLSYQKCRFENRPKSNQELSLFHKSKVFMADSHRTQQSYVLWGCKYKEYMSRYHRCISQMVRNYTSIVLWVNIYRLIVPCLKSLGPEVFQIWEHCIFSTICTDFTSRTFLTWKSETIFDLKLGNILNVVIKLN